MKDPCVCVYIYIYMYIYICNDTLFSKCWGLGRFVCVKSIFWSTLFYIYVYGRSKDCKEPYKTADLLQAVLFCKKNMCSVDQKIVWRVVCVLVVWWSTIRHFYRALLIYYTALLETHTTLKRLMESCMCLWMESCMCLGRLVCVSSIKRAL